MSTYNRTEEPRRAHGASFNRRQLLQGAALAGGLVIGGLGGTAVARAQTGAHPGMLHTQADFSRMREKLDADQAPWSQGWDELIANGHASSDWTPRPTDTIVRGGDGQNYPQLYRDVHAAYQNALHWRISGSTAHRDKAVEICNAWSGTLQEITGNADRYLAAGIYGYQFCNAAELVRDAPGFDLGRFRQMMTDVFYPLNNSFLVNHNDACITNYWANWDLCNMASIMAIGILRDDQSLFDQAVDYFWNGEGNGSIENAIPFVHGDGLAQWQESGRDQAHSMMGIGLMAAIMEMAWNQGVDLYSARDDAFAKAAEYVARYNLGHDDLPFTTYSWGSGQNCAYREHTQISADHRGQERPVWEMVYNHYGVRRGRAMPNVARMAAQVRAEGGGGDYGLTSGGFDALGFGTLAHMRSSSWVDGGVYTLMSERSGKVLDNGNSTTVGARVMQWDENGGPQQRWRIRWVGEGRYSITCERSGMALDNSTSTSDGATVIQWTYHGGSQQRWRITDVGGGAVKLTCQSSGKVLDNGNGESNGDTAIQWADNGGPQQRWFLRRVG
ncbi:RICIN domain-containing protein [Glycomyces sp. L485]|uniref:RICIN domain-containing protein n=1 Tax=Glycomyces sp. L485 TaxID=2909235 RepID=UPI001F4AD251|nr:RICIN domain-containing protein [Glycomyces sp. L485]MCH7232730.1 RICIN domain-containing protein [Glycomyces sp. L485]